MVKKIKQTKQKREQFQVIDLLQDFQMSKFFFILYTQEFAFDWDLKKKYNFTQKQIQKYSRVLEELQLCTFQLLGELSFNQKEAILKITPDAHKIDEQNPKVYTITKIGKQEGKQLANYICKESTTHESLFNLVKQLIQSSNSFRDIKKQIKELEETGLERTVTLPNGTLFVKPTSRLLKAKKEARIELQEKLKLSHTKQSTELQLNNQNTQLQLYEQDNTSSPQHREILQLTKEDDVILQNKGLSDKEIKEANREYEKQIKSRLEDLKQETAHYEKENHKLLFQKFESTIGKYYLNKEEPVEEGLNFLDSLKVVEK